MDFSSSLNLGNSILANIENAEKKHNPSTNKKANSKTRESACEIIDESPTYKSNRSGKTTKENTKEALTQSRYRRRALRKEKSDSLLPSNSHRTPDGSSTALKTDNLSDYFKSPMELRVFTGEKKDNIANSNELLLNQTKRQRLSDRGTTGISNNLEDIFAESMRFEEHIQFPATEHSSHGKSFINIDDSSIDMGENNKSEDMLLEKAIFSEDLKELGLSFSSQTEFPGKPQNVTILDISEKNLNQLKETDDIHNLVYDMSSEINFLTPANAKIFYLAEGFENSKDNHAKDYHEEEKIVNIEETSFIGSRNTSVASDHKFAGSTSIIPPKEQLISALKQEERSFCEMKTSMHSSSPRNNMSPVMHDDLNLSKCSGRVLNWSTSSIAEATCGHVQGLVHQEDEKQNPGNITALKNISNWGLPETIVKEYYTKGIREMFDWQVKCLSNPKVLFDHANLVYSAPTSAGKTLVSEILTIKTIIERRKKALIILPFISVVREKMAYLQDLLTSSGYRVDGFYGGYTPPGGFDNINIAICTIEKANSIVNRLLEQKKLDDIGMIVVDEIHLISDPGRGYILELLLAKVAYMCRTCAMKIQIVAMSATLANIVLLQEWLHAEFYVTDFRPVELQEMIKIGKNIYDNRMEFIRELNCDEFSDVIKDQDHISQLCMETIVIDCSVIVFCPSKDWCETLSLNLAESIMNLMKAEKPVSEKVRLQFNKSNLDEVKMQLINCPAGLDSVLAKVITFGCAYHHAGLTSEERDIIEGGFKAGTIKVLAATSTLSSGVNLPARRVIIRSPLFAGKKMNSLTYKQMIGRAGRTGHPWGIYIDLQSNELPGWQRTGLLQTLANKILPECGKQCKIESLMPLKRALLEVISSGIATTRNDVQNFLECTLLHIQRKKESNLEGNGTQLFDPESLTDEADPSEEEKDPLTDSLNFLVEYEFVRLQMNDETNQMNYVPTRLGMACLSSSLPPNDGLLLFSELQKSRRCFVLETELQAVYLVTPYSVCYQLNEIDWLLYLDLYEKLSSAMKRVAELIGVKESFLVKAMRGLAKLDYKTLQIHKRFYTAMALQELVNEVPLNKVATKYKCSRGLLQSLQQMSSTFAGIVTSFCNALNWTMLALIVSEFKERLFFGVHRDLIDLMRIPDLNAQKARALFNAGITGLVELANADCFTVEKILFNSISFESEKKREDEDDYDQNKRNVVRCLYITGRTGLTIKDAARLLISNARQHLQHEMGVENVRWSNNTTQNDTSLTKSSVLNENQPISEEICAPSDQVINDEKQQKQEINEHSTLNKNDNVDTSPMPDDSINEKQCPKSPNSIKDDFQSKSNVPSIQRKSDRVAKTSTKQTPRRSPRNHTTKSMLEDAQESVSIKGNKEHSQVETKTKSNISDIFTDSSFNINTQIAGALDKQKSQKPFYGTEVAKKDMEESNPNDESVEEIIASQTSKEVTSSSLRSNATRLARARLTQKKQLRKMETLQNEIIVNSENIIKSGPNASSSIEISDCASSSLLNNPMLLNSSHILSVSKTEQSSASFKYISIIDICGDRKLFRKCICEISNSERIGLSVGVQKLAHKKRSIIGANLLINQVQSCDEEKDVDFVFDDIFFVCGISLCSAGNTVFFLNLQRNENENCSSREEIIQEIIKIFENDSKILRIFDAKEQLKVLKKCLPNLERIRAKIEDPKIGNWLLQPDKEMNLKTIVQQYAPECSALISLAGSYVSNRSVGLNSSSSILGKIRASIEACVSLHVLENQIENLELNGNLKAFFHDLEMPVQCALWKMEAVGFPVDQTSLGVLSKEILGVMKKLEMKMYSLHGSRFNLSSSSAVARVLGLHRKANGRMSTAKQILEKIDSPMSNLILNYRKLGATLNKTVQPLIQNVRNGRIHGNSITFTSTGRISMHEPNLQNVAKDFTVEIDPGESYFISCRSSFSSVEKTMLISVDFCQLEMRILTHLSQDPVLMKIMHSEDDIFRAIAAKWNKLSQEEVSEKLRNGTKQLCYGIIYGMGLKALAETLKCDNDEASSLLEQFHGAYPGIRAYTNKVIRFAKQNGYVETITGRRRYLYHITSNDEAQRSQAERQALNTTIQGSAADIAKKAIVRTERNLEKYSKRIGLNSSNVKFILHLHDELIFEVTEDKIHKVAKILRTSMENSAQLNVPLRVKLKAGKSWGTLREI